MIKQNLINSAIEHCNRTGLHMDAGSDVIYKMTTSEIMAYAVEEKRGDIEKYAKKTIARLEGEGDTKKNLDHLRRLRRMVWDNLRWDYIEQYREQVV